MKRLYPALAVLLGAFIMATSVTQAAFAPLSIPAGGTGTTTAASGQLLYGGSGTTNQHYQSVATSSLGASAPITFSGTIGSQVGGVGGSFGCTNASAGVTGCLTGTDWSTFNNKQATLSTPTWPIILTGTTLSFGGLSTTTNLTQGQIPYVTGVNTFGQVATTTLGGTGVLSVSNAPVVIGTSPSVVSITGGANGQILGWASGVPTWLGTTTAGTGLTYNGGSPGSFSVNVSQNISTLSNLTNNGLVTTSGGTGALSVTVPGTGVLTALGVNVGSAGAFVTFNGAGGTPSSLTLTNATNLPIVGGTTGTLTIARGGTGTTTTQSGRIYYGGGDGLSFQSVATTSETCTSASGVSCTAHDVLTGGGAISLSAIPNTSLANSTISGVALGGTLAGLSATNASLTFSGTYTGTAAQTVGLNVGNSNTWSVVQQFNAGVGVAGLTSTSLIGIGTTTPKWNLTTASSTGPQITLTDGSATDAPFNLRSINNLFYVSTSSPTTFATTSSSLLGFDSSTASTTLIKLDVSGSATSTYGAGINIKTGCFAINNTCVGSSGGGSPGGSGTELQYRSGASTFGAVSNSAFTTQAVGNGYLGLGTTTPAWTLQLASSTQPQLALSDGTATSNHWTLRSISNSLYITSASPTTFATSSTAAIAIDSNNAVTFGVSGTVIGSTNIFAAVPVRAPDGSAAAPSFSFSNDATTGLFRPSTGSAIATSILGNEVWRSTAGLYTGFGTTTPHYLLQLASSTAPQIAFSDASLTSNQFAFRAINGNFYFATSSPLTFATSSISIYSILNNGNFGIATNTPSQPITLATTTLSVGSFSEGYASSTLNATYYQIQFGTTTAGMWTQPGRVWRIIMQQNISIELNSTSTNALPGQHIILHLCQDGTGSRTVTFVTPGQIRWGNGGTTTVSSTANTCSDIGGYFDSISGHWNLIASSTGMLNF